MDDLKWSDREKKIARSVFNAALQQELAATIVAFKEMAARAEGPEDMWAVEHWLSRERRGIDTKYDYRYSQLIHVFGILLREGRISTQQIEGLAQDKRSDIAHIAAL